MKTLRIMLAVSVLLGGLAVTACNKGTGEKVGEKLDKAAEKTKDAVKDAGEKVEDAVKK